MVGRAGAILPIALGGVLARWGGAIGAPRSSQRLRAAAIPMAVCRWNSIWGFPRDNLGFPDQIAPIGGSRWSIAHRRVPASFRDGYGFRCRQ